MRLRARLLATAAVAAALLGAPGAFASAGERLPALSPAPNDGLTRALQRGTISEARYALERATALFRPAEVERRYGELGPVDPRGATLVLRDLVVRHGSLTPDERKRADALLARPDDADGDPQEAYAVEPVSPLCTEHTCIHWVATTPDAPPPDDADGNGVPDQVDQTARVLEEVWQREVVDGGYRPPKSDLESPNHGPDGRIDVYLADVGAIGLYGYCTTDDPKAFTRRNGPWDVSAYCLLDNDYSVRQFSGAAQGEAALKVTAAHEFFHAVQFAYDFLEDRWFLEGTAVWMEDEVYDDINDNYQYLEKSALRRPEVPLDLGIAGDYHPLSGFQYGSFVFFRFLSERYGGPELIRRVWDFADGSPQGPDQYSLQAIATALKERGATLRAAFARFGAENSSPASFYEEGASYPTPGVARIIRLSRAKPRAKGSVRLDHMTSWYASIRATGSKRIRIVLDLPGQVRGAGASAVLEGGSETPSVVPIALDRKGDGARTLLVPEWARSVKLVLTNASSRFRCWQGSPLACQGYPLDDDQLFRYELRLLP